MDEKGEERAKAFGVLDISIRRWVDLEFREFRFDKLLVVPKSSAAILDANEKLRGSNTVDNILEKGWKPPEVLT